MPYKSKIIIALLLAMAMSINFSGSVNATETPPPTNTPWANVNFPTQNYVPYCTGTPPATTPTYIWGATVPPGHFCEFCDNVIEYMRDDCWNSCQGGTSTPTITPIPTFYLSNTIDASNSTNCTVQEDTNTYVRIKCSVTNNYPTINTITVNFKPKITARFYYKIEFLFPNTVTSSYSSNKTQYWSRGVRPGGYGDFNTNYGSTFGPSTSYSPTYGYLGSFDGYSIADQNWIFEVKDVYYGDWPETKTENFQIEIQHGFSFLPTPGPTSTMGACQLGYVETPSPNTPPIVWINPPIVVPGACYTIVPEFLFTLPDVTVLMGSEFEWPSETIGYGGASVCIDWLQIEFSFLGMQLDSFIGVIAWLFVAGLIYKEIAS